MRCEVCGRKIHGTAIRAVIAGANLTVCVECSKHGKIIREELGRKVPKKTTLPFSAKMQRTKIAGAKVEITQEVVESYHVKIRQAREKRGLSQEELGKKINEKASVISKLETGKMTPNNVLVTKLEHALGIKLLVPIKEEKLLHEMPKFAGRETTLGDLIQVNKKDGEEPTERKQS